MPPDGDSRPASFWLLADNSIELGANRLRFNTFVASLKHALLFHDQLLLSDSLVVNTPNLRRAFQEDPGLRKYLTSGCLRIARRKQDDGLVDLIELRDKLESAGSMNPGFDADSTPFLNNIDLIDLQKLTPYVPYELTELSTYYTNSIKDLTSDSRFRQALGADFDAICSAILKRIEERRYLDQTFFERNVADSLEAQLGAETWSRNAETIHLFESAFYRNAIPATLRINTIFAAEHEHARKILRNINSDQEAGAIRIDLSRGAKSLYESVLLAMSVDMLDSLRRSDEFRRFQTSLRKLELAVDIEDPTIPDSLDEAFTSLRAYHQLIDDTLRIPYYFQQGSALLDRWHLKGVLRNGGWLLNIAANLASRKGLRAEIVSNLAEMIHNGGKDVALVYYASGGYAPLEKALDELPTSLKKLTDAQNNAFSTTARIDSRLEVQRAMLSDTIYGPPA